MKAKYNRMIDEYVKKKYGDLDRGVLSDEVKYKVLFKIYRKKYRREKERVKILTADTGEKESQDSYLDWLHDDITWCCRECSDMDCERNLMNRRMTTGLISMADMYDPFKCPIDAEIHLDKKPEK